MGRYLDKQLLLNTIATSELVPMAWRPRLLRALGVRIGGGWVFSGQRFRPGSIALGDRVMVNRGCTFDPGSAGITVGDDVALGVGVVLSAASHHQGPHRKRAMGGFSAPIVLGDGCWLGARVVVLPGVTIAPGCIIGAGAVVTKDTDPDGVYTGVPARRVRDLD